MAPIDDAIEDLKSRDLGEHFTLREVAEKYQVNRSTLGRRWRGVTASREDGYLNQQALDQQQELELIRYITKLTERGLPPTREIIRNFSSEIAHRQLSDRWVSHFITRHQIHIISKWTTAMDRVRHLADSESKYRLYFELLHRKITEYHLEARDIYNIDEKGFLISLIGRSKRIFSRRQWEKKEVRASLQDRSREFLTLLACCCADRSSLPPSLIYAAKKGAIRLSWVEDIKAGEYKYKARKLRSSVHHLSVQNELLKHKNKGLKEALQHKKKQRKKGKALDLQQRQEYHARAKKQREEARLQRQVELEEKRVERQRLKEMKEVERAEKAAERARKVEAQHQKKSIQQAQQRKRKASRVLSPSNKRQKRASAAHAGVQAGDELSATPAKVTSRGRNVNLPQKYR
ncbi:hypothetical protein PtrM4_126820 [Pyrenophora tritici-repentis]|uniref:HTH CENPB-type domain-containing protein n=1 Tax=Pyrenophora tritici-repentis TaxID=45151 RepID=A0A834RQU6_9PLEO|nr:hypothetical protein PtrM4_126820 [Pyrenophora tritici-repentis]